MDILVLVLFFALPSLAAHTMIFDRSIKKGSSARLAVLQATLASAAVSSLLGFLSGVALTLFAFNLKDPAGYGRMMFFWAGAFSLVALPALGMLVGSLVGTGASLIRWIAKNDS